MCKEITRTGVFTARFVVHFSDARAPLCAVYMREQLGRGGIAERMKHSWVCERSARMAELPSEFYLGDFAGIKREFS